MQQRYEKHWETIWCIVGAVVAFLILYRAWFYVMGGLAIIGAVWVIQKYKS